MDQGFSNFTEQTNYARILSNILIQEVWGRVQGCAFLTRSLAG